MSETKKKILFIDDDRFLRTVWAKALSDSGYEVDTAEDGKQGLEKMKEIKPDLVILDIVMPGWSGFDFLEAQKKDPEVKDIKVVVISSIAGGDDVTKAKEMGAIGYINKEDATIRVAAEKVGEFLK
ncbi:MAG: response regulator [Patescibacteria group bacterium]